MIQEPEVQKRPLGECETQKTLIGPPGSINFIGAIEYEYVISTLRARLELD